jgi:putative transcriptional regulator
MELGGKLLVALPMLVEDPFRRTVILLLRHDDTGALGLVLNRPSPVPVADALPPWDERAAEPAVVFVGGPVEPEVAIAIGDHGGRVETIDLDGDPALLTARAVRVFAGYAGWSGGQLEGEVGRGAWAVVDAEPGDAFRADIDDLWHAVLARQTEPVLRRLAMLPDDLTVN